MIQVNGKKNKSSKVVEQPEVLVEVEEKKEEPKAIDEAQLVWETFSNRYPMMANAFLVSMEEQLLLLSRKMLDYGTTNLKAGTELKTKEEINFALQGIWFRINDKVQRWKNMTMTGENPNNESLYDSFMDIANYAIIAKLISRGIWDDK